MVMVDVDHSSLQTDSLTFFLNFQSFVLGLNPDGRTERQTRRP